MLELDIKKLLVLQATACLNTNELAAKAKIQRVTLSKIIHGKGNATPKTIGLLAKALNVGVAELVTES